MVDFILNNLEFLWLVAAAIIAIIADYVRLRFSITTIKNDITRVNKRNFNNEEKLEAVSDSLQQLAIGFASFDGKIQAEINKISIEFARSNDK